MRTFSKAVLLVAGVHAATITAPSLAFAQAPQPVPYNQAPVPYGQPAPSSTAPAQPGARAQPPASPGSDVIYLKNGGILRGTIIDAIPNAQARIQLATGEIATVPWSEIARFEHGSTPSTPAPPPQPPARPEPKRAALGGVMVHIDSPSPVELQRKGDVSMQLSTGPSARLWETVCASPCDQQIATKGLYRIVGDGARPSGEFGLPSAPGPVTLTVSPSSTGWFVGGIVLLSVGGITMLVGLFIGLVASLASTVDTSGTSQDWATGGWTAFGLGAAGLVVGIVAMVGSRHTGVDVSNGDAGGHGMASPWTRVASWRGATPEQKLAPPVIGVPIFNTSF
jgi:hypothetical protein